MNKPVSESFIVTLLNEIIICAQDSCLPHLLAWYVGLSSITLSLIDISQQILRVKAECEKTSFTGPPA